MKNHYVKSISFENFSYSRKNFVWETIQFHLFRSRNFPLQERSVSSRRDSLKNITGRIIGGTKALNESLEGALRCTKCQAFGSRFSRLWLARGSFLLKADTLHRIHIHTNEDVARLNRAGWAVSRGEATTS